MVHESLRAAVYVLHFPDGSHYIGSTGKDVMLRVERHCSGVGSAWVARQIERVGLPAIGYVEFHGSREKAYEAERRAKGSHRTFVRQCVFCKGGKG